MSDTFALDSARFARQADVFHSAGDELAAALERLEVALTSEGRCWGNDEPGRQFEKVYKPDASQTTGNVRSLVQILRHTASQIKHTADNVDAQDLDIGGHVRNSGDLDGTGLTLRVSGAQDRTAPSAPVVTASANDGRPPSIASAPRTDLWSDHESPFAPSDSAYGAQPSDSLSPVRPGAQQDSTAPETTQRPTPGSADVGLARDPSGLGSATGTGGIPSPTPAGGPGSAANLRPLEPKSAAPVMPSGDAFDGAYGDPTTSAPVSSVGGATANRGSSENTPSVTQSSPPGGGAPPRIPWPGLPKGRPDKKRKETKPRKRLPVVLAPEDADYPPSVDSAVLGAPSAERTPRRRSATTPWSNSGASGSEPTRSPRKDAAHGAI